MNMMVSRRAMLGGIALAGGFAATARPALALVDSGPAFPATRAFLNGFVERKQLPGTLATIGRAMAVPHVIAAGSIALDSGAAVDENSLWRVYSMTKPVTGIAAMLLVDQGKLRLDQPLAEILPAFANMQVQITPDGSITDLRPAKTPITIRHLLTHTAGLGYTIVQKGPLKDAYVANGILPAKVTRLPLPGIENSPTAPTLAEFADRLAKLPLVYEPGTKWSYSVSLDLLGRVIEVVSGLPFDVFLKERMFDPLGMTSSWFQVPQSEAGRLTTNYAPYGGALVPIDPGASSIFLEKPEFAFGGAGLVTSAHDYDRFLMMLAGKGAIGTTRLMSEATAMLAMSDLFPQGVDAKGTFIDGHGFGAGGRVSLPGNPGGPGNFGWGGAAGTIAFVNPFSGLRVAGYAQYMPPEILDFQSKLPEAILKDLAGA